MPVPKQTPYIFYTANGLTTVFPFDFYVIAASDVRVSVNDIILTSGYSVNGVGNLGGGNVNFLTPPASGDVVALERIVPVERLTDYQDNGDLLADTVNKDFDRLWMAIQRGFTLLDLTLQRPLRGGPFNAKNIRITSLADPADPQDATTKQYVDTQDSALRQYVDTQDAGITQHVDEVSDRSLRVPENSVIPIPPLRERANKLLAFSNSGQPLMVDPASIGGGGGGGGFQTQDTAFIRGFDLSVYNDEVKVSPGAAVIHSTNAILESTSEISVSISQLAGPVAASTWYHIYLYNNAGAPDIEISDVSPVVNTYPSHMKANDSSRRYLGSFRVFHDGSVVGLDTWQGMATLHSDGEHNPTNVLLLHGTENVITPFDISEVVPPTAKEVTLMLVNYTQEANTAALLYSKNRGDSFITAVRTGVQEVIPNFPLLSYPELFYKNTNTNPVLYQGLIVYASGYNFMR